MTRLRLLLVGLLALVLSGAVTYLVYQNLKSRLEPPEERPGHIVVASQKLSLGERIESDNVKLVPWPEDAQIDGAFTNVTEVVGRGVVVPMSANEPVLESKLALRGAGAGLTSAIPDGMRAVSVRVNEIVGVAGFVLPGSRVDVILSGSPERNQDIEMARIILENVQVLAAGQNLEQDREGTAQEVNVVTLLVTPEQAQTLALAQNDGRIQLALRNPLDLEEAHPSAVHKTTLYRGALPPPPERPQPTRTRRAARPSPPPPPPPAPPEPVRYEVELIQGGQREKVEFEAQSPPTPPGGSNPEKQR